MTTKSLSISLGLGILLGLAACSRKQPEPPPVNDEARANAAITQMNQAMFRQMGAQPSAGSAPSSAQPPR